MENLAPQIIRLLRTELPSSLLQSVEEIEMLIKQEEYRQAYLKMYEITKSPLWVPTSEYLQLMEKFWWSYAN